MAINWPTFGEQVQAVLNAPIPFFIVIVGTWLTIWGLMVWRYKAVMEKTKELFELSRSEIQIRTESMKRIEGELRDALKKRDNEEANQILTRFHTANNAIYEAASRRPWLDPIGTRDTPLVLKMFAPDSESKVVP